MEVDESSAELQSVISDEWIAETARLEYSWNILGPAGNLSLDIARAVLESYRIITAKEKCPGRRRQVGDHVQCPKCSTPWIAGFCQSRLLGCPRNPHNIRSLLKKERRHPSKLSSLEKMKVSSFHLQKNIIEVSCLICKFKMRELCSVPVKEKTLIEKTMAITKQKKKKRKPKEVNAGLLLSSPKTASMVAKDPKATSVSNKCAIQTREKKFAAHSFSSNSRVENGKKKKVVKINISAIQNFSKLSTEEKTIRERVRKSIAKPSKCKAKSQSSFTTGSRPLRNACKEKQERQKQLMGLKSAMLRDADKHSSTSNKSTLNDFLSSLF